MGSIFFQINKNVNLLLLLLFFIPAKSGFVCLILHSCLNWVLALFVVGNSESPSKTFKKGRLKRVAVQWGSLTTLGSLIPLNLSPTWIAPPPAPPLGQRVADQLQHRPSAWSKPRRHGGGTDAVAAWWLLPMTMNRLGELNPQRLMVTDEVIVSPPPFQV